jgi:hypothetical protein
MHLKAPGILTFILSVILVVICLMSKFFGANVPFLKYHEFWGVLLAQVILVGGCMLRGM